MLEHATMTRAATVVQPDPTNTVRLKHPGRIIVGILCVVALVGFLFALAANPHISWSDVAAYLVFPKILAGVLVTLELSIISTVVGLSIGVILAIMKLSSNPLAQMLSNLYIWFFRGTPVLVQLIFWFNLAFLFPTLTIAIPFTTIGYQWDMNVLMTGFNAAMLGLALNLGAYAAETVRAGIQAVDIGQSEAASSIGMTPAQRMRIVVLPQAGRIILPPIGNEFISMLKTTSLVYVVAGNDLMTNASQIYKQNSKIMELLIVVSIWYMVMTAVATYFQNKLEKKFGTANLPPSPRASWGRSLLLAAQAKRKLAVDTTMGSGGSL
ncbi:amino acid ABC transporter permease [Glaciibacter psychrotolerans]|uniref:Polar amino acid transport system permease protein n=1 Tax=Glaciibacter psychrotolerans TaxID=670054 RepID=A0A7Z0J6E5_9MICO|nr:amino acid ABC transporter permease [Leifsonia psychrotolerans]NYJ20437.1 polar amino acid transport system permease protein [Leifsonia psychrotolerans]